MAAYICGRCLLAEEADSNDMVWCWPRKEYRKVNDYPCARWKAAPAAYKRDRQGGQDY